MLDQHKKRNAVQWMNEHTRLALEWEWVWKQVQPSSVLGKSFKEQLQPFSKGEEQEWLEELQLSQRLEACAEELDRQRCQEALQLLPDVRPFLALLAKGETGVQADWFLLKQFIQNSLVIIRVLLPVDQALRYYEDCCVQGAALLGEEEQSLTLSELNSALFHAQQQYAQLEQELLSKREQRRRRIQEELAEVNVAVRRDHYIYVPASEERSLSVCRLHPELLEKQQNPFEVIFQLLEGEEEKKHKFALEQQQTEIERLELETLKTLAGHFRPLAKDLEQLARLIGGWDWRLAKLSWKRANNLAWPSLAKEKIDVEQGRYLPLERKLVEQGHAYTPISLSITYGCTVLAGMNMGGKSVALKTIGSLCLMAHFGLPVPAQTFRTPLFRGIQLISGDQQSVQKGLSTFGAEMHQLTEAWQASDQLLLLDELARGTNPAEGEALVFAVTKLLAERRDNACVSVTHFTFKEQIAGASFYQAGRVNEEGHVSYELFQVQQADVPQQALFIAQKMGVSASVLEQARAYLAQDGG